jgi:hypothetical protein
MASVAGKFMLRGRHVLLEVNVFTRVRCNRLKQDLSAHYANPKAESAQEGFDNE